MLDFILNLIILFFSVALVAWVVDLYTLGVEMKLVDDRIEELRKAMRGEQNGVL